MSNEAFLKFTTPMLDDSAIAEVTDVLRSGWLTTGPRVKKFEDMLQEYLGGRRSLAVSSATAGLHIACLAIGLKEGEEVITTPLTFVATLNTIVQAGAKPVLVDIEKNGLNIDVAQIEAAITPRTKAIMPVHFAGAPVDLDPLYALAKKHNLRVIEDCAHAIGTEYKGKKLGAFGDIQIFSFHPNKNITTGEGGCVTTADPEIIHKIERLRFHGIDRDAFNRFGKGGSQHYDIVLPGFKYNMMDIQAALGIHQLPKLDGFIAEREKRAKIYQERLKGWTELSLPIAPNYNHRHAWHLYTPLIESPMGRDGFIEAMKEENIGLGLHYTAAHLFTYYRERFGYKQGQFPNTENAASKICSLPLFPTMTSAEQERVIAAMAKIFKKRMAA
ncbi:MAG: DegT/DnrJ/EryC1/StrS family aminotransferase [Dongiaceae bacterium]